MSIETNMRVICNVEGTTLRVSGSGYFSSTGHQIDISSVEENGELVVTVRHIEPTGLVGMAFEQVDASEEFDLSAYKRVTVFAEDYRGRFEVVAIPQ